MEQSYKISLLGLALFACAVIAFGSNLGIEHATAQETDPGRKELGLAVETEIAAQKEADAWSMEKQQVIGEIRQLKTRLEWLSYQNKKYAAYIATEKRAIEELERKDAKMRNLRKGLEPFLDKTIERLAGFVEEDLDFLQEEREQRLSFLKDSVNDYHLSMSEKLQRVLEALNVEAEYGRTIEVETRSLSLAEVGRVEADVLRVGRIAVIYRSLDGKRVGRMNPGTGGWEPVDETFSRAIRDTIEMARQQKSVELVDLPIGGFAR